MRDGKIVKALKIFLTSPWPYSIIVPKKSLMHIAFSSSTTKLRQPFIRPPHPGQDHVFAF